MSLIYNATFDSQTRVLSLLDKAGNVISSCEVPRNAVDDPNKPLMLRAIEDNSSVMLQKYGGVQDIYQTSTNGEDWTNYTLGTEISLNKGESVYFRRRNQATQSESKYVWFVMEGKIEAWHNAYSMIRPSFTNTSYGVDRFGMYKLFKDCTSLTKAPLLLNALADYCYQDMFSGCTSLTKAPELPATHLVNYCYQSMFSGCTSLKQAPELPATTLVKYCYAGMFSGCTSLTKVPSLPATSLADYCYSRMFTNCTSLTKAPSLPATTIAKFSYSYMFYGCTSLTQAPKLPAKSSAESSYSYMFYGCTSLTQAPKLPATNLSDYCYQKMFSGCTSLNEVRISALSAWTGALDNWLSGVSATGDFYCDPNATIFPTDSASGIPSGWNRKPLSDYPSTP